MYEGRGTQGIGYDIIWGSNINHIRDTKYKKGMLGMRKKSRDKGEIGI